jgi:hypothetical protein
MSFNYLGVFETCRGWDKEFTLLAVLWNLGLAQAETCTDEDVIRRPALFFLVFFLYLAWRPHGVASSSVVLSLVALRANDNVIARAVILLFAMCSRATNVESSSTGS